MQRVLDRLKQENLRGPVIDSWVMVDPEDSQRDNSDLDELDPRWLTVFMDYFILECDDQADDLLFFVHEHDRVSGVCVPYFNHAVKRRVSSVALPSDIGFPL